MIWAKPTCLSEKTDDMPNPQPLLNSILRLEATDQVLQVPDKQTGQPLVEGEET